MNDIDIIGTYHKNLNVRLLCWSTMAPLFKWGNVWGTFVMVPVTIRICFLYFHDNFQNPDIVKHQKNWLIAFFIRYVVLFLLIWKLAFTNKIQWHVCITINMQNLKFVKKTSETEYSKFSDVDPGLNFIVFMI